MGAPAVIDCAGQRPDAALFAGKEGIAAVVEAGLTAIRAKSQEAAAAQADAMILNAKIRKESLQILTADQLAKLKERRDQRPDGPPRQRRPKQ